MWMFTWFSMKKIDSLVVLCHKGLRYLLQFITALYVLAMGMILPYYYNWETDYSRIGTNKAEFFRKYGFAAGKVFLALLFFYGLFSLWLWWKKNREAKGKVPLLINDGLDTLSLTDRFMIIYVVALCLSYYYSDYRQKLLLGISGWYMGFLPQLVLIGSYFAISRFLPRHLGKWLPFILSVISMPVFLLGLLNRYGYLAPGMTSSGPSYISTIGNINWFCGYFVVLFPLTAALFVFCKRESSEPQWLYKCRRILLGINCAIGFATGITQGSDSGILALAAMMILLFGLAAAGKGEEGKETFGHFLELQLLFGVTLCTLALVQFAWPEQNTYQTSLYTMLTKGALPWVWGVVALLLYLFYTARHKRLIDCRGIRKIWFCLAICLLVTLTSFIAAIIINTRHPGSLGALSENPLFVFDREWGSSRGGTWMAGIGTWQAQDTLHKAVGVGPDGMWYYIDSGKAPDLLQAVQEQFGESRLTNAHGEWITILANLGIFGLIGYAGVVVSAIWRFVKGSTMIGAEARAPQGAENAAGTIAAAIGCGLSLFTYTVNNIFSFQQTMQMTQVFLIMGLGEYMLRQQGERRES
ncbi:MAG: O-antigen ligase family protein [Lachnospiraceae bacterium]|nr:O-antigen ligase family protein [Lachnospiraceae bacterium]